MRLSLSLPFSLLEKAIEEFYLIQLKKIWQDSSIFVPVNLSFHSPDLWSWVSTILEMEVNPDNFHLLNTEIVLTEQLFNLIIKKTQLKFIYFSRNRISIKTSREFSYRLRKIHLTLTDIYQGEVPTVISLINERLILGTEHECPWEVMSRLGITSAKI